MRFTRKKFLLLLAAAGLTAFASACGSAASPEKKAPSPAEPHGRAVVYFSATGHTKGAAEKIASAAGADLYEILPAEPYTRADLNYRDSESRSSREMNDSSARPAMAGEIDLSGYKTVFLGYPIWFGEAPRIMSTFVESHDLTGKTVIPFCTSGGSGIGASAEILEKQAGSGRWLEGTRFGSSPSESEIRSWLGSLSL